jgi:hypothetical protein
LHLARTWPRQDQGGITELEKWLASHRDTRLIIVDTWQKFRPPKIRGANDYEQDYRHAGDVKGIADHHGIALMVLHHCRKVGAADPLDEVSGTLGLTGCADAVLVLRRERGQLDAVLFATGRDIEEQEIALRWDPEHARWSALGEADNYRLSPERSQVLDVLRARAEAVSIADVAEATGKIPNAAKQLLWRMEKDGQVKSNGSGQYSAP